MSGFLLGIMSGDKQKVVGEKLGLLKRSLFNYRRVSIITFAFGPTI